MSWYNIIKSSSSNPISEIYPNWKSLPDGRLLGYRVSRLDPEMNRAISGSNSRLSWNIEPGTVIQLPSPGLFLTNTKQYAKDYYIIHDHNILQEIAFDPSSILSGSLLDKEPEVSISLGVIVSSTIISL